ncbi:MAG: hypothetical protein M3Y85_01825 [Bacteroidota bacterium]|nr:hypothetical protein [Bacteroidota bacterium]
MCRHFAAGFLFQTLFTITCYSQNVDSLSRSIDSSSKKLQEVTRDFNQWQDSSHQISLRRFSTKDSKTLDEFLAEMKERESSENRQLYIRIGAGALFLIVLIYSQVRRRRKKDSST